MENSTNCSSKNTLINTPCRKIGLHRLIKSDKIIRSLNFSPSTVASRSPVDTSSPSTSSNLHNNNNNQILRETNIETPKRTKIVDNDCISIAADATTTPTSSHIYQTYNRQQIVKRKKENLINNENIKRKRYCGLSKHFSNKSPKQQSSPSPILILNNKDINMKTDCNTNNIVNNINKIENNTNTAEDPVITNLKSSIRMWTNGFKKALEILEKKYEPQEDAESILKKCKITINLSDYENI